tara:strand:+ start:4663 stop:4986 length:324 start_codon:yes stop_codon:yes gene_type:complete
VKEVVAIIKGDDAEATGQKILRQADSAFKAQIASLNGDTIAFEDAVENAQDRVNLCRVNRGDMITDRNQYIRNLLDAKNNLTEAEEELAVHNEKLTFLNEQFKLLDE